jgi:UDP-N-acetylmuramyl pentapeptide phosphotransferase/UDP-N-acetylglucosamine-1-phosphate transferase
VVLAFAVSFGCALIALRWLLSPALRALAEDRPNERSLHSKVVPRTGGLAILVGASGGAALAMTLQVTVLWGVALCLGIVSFLDDRRGLPVAVRFLAHFLAALAIAVWLRPQVAWYWWAFAILATIWLINLYNFMDGSDGLAGGMGLFGFSAYALGAHAAGAEPLATLSVALAGGCLGFLCRNFPPARIFMGDAGSTVLGLCAASIGLIATAQDLWPLWFPALVFLPFVMDASVTLLKRAARGEQIWKAHREHYYQRLIRSGWSHRRVALSCYALMLGTAASGLTMLTWARNLGWPVLGLWVLAMGGLMGLTEIRWSRVTMEQH